MKSLTLSIRFATAVWALLKPIGYKRYGNTFIYTGEEVKTIVEIQRGKYSSKDYPYSFINISYCKSSKEAKSFFDADFFHFRHDFFNSDGFYNFGSGRENEYPPAFNYTNDRHIEDIIDIIRTIEPHFRVETFKVIERTYKATMRSPVWDDVFKKLIS